MKTEKTSKKKIITIVLGIIALCLVIGASYAVWNYTFTGQANTLEKEMIEVELLESNTDVISITKALPKSDTQGIKQSETFEFAVTTRTRAVTDIFYDLKIEKVNVDSGYTALEDDDIRIYLTDYNNKALIAPIKISDLYNNTFYRTYNKHTKETNEVTTKFKLKAWIDEDVLVNDWNENTKLQYKFKIGTSANEYDRDAVSLNPKGKVPEGAYYANLATGTFYDEMPESPSDGDAYLYGDYTYLYSSANGKWAVGLATQEMFEQYGMAEAFAAYPKATRDQTSYDPILESINGEPIFAIENVFQNCTSLVESPVIPDGVTHMYAAFDGATSLVQTPVLPKGVTNTEYVFGRWPLSKSDTNVYSFNTNDVHTGTPLDSINGYTTNYKSLNKTFFLKHNIGSLGRIESQEVCYILNNKKYCLKGGDNGASYETNKATLFESFGEENCSVSSSHVSCSASGLRASAYADGYVSALLTVDSSYCYVFDNGYADCIE